MSALLSFSNVPSKNNCSRGYTLILGIHADFPGGRLHGLPFAHWRWAGSERVIPTKHPRPSQESALIRVSSWVSSGRGYSYSKNKVASL